MCGRFLKIKVVLLICVTSAEFNLNSLNATFKSLDTFNQTKITLNNTWDYKDTKNVDDHEHDNDDDDDPIVGSEIKRKANENEKLLLNTPATTKIPIKQKPLKAKNIIKQPQPNYDQRNSNANSYHQLPALKFNKQNNENNHDNYFKLYNKLKTRMTSNSKYKPKYKKCEHENNKDNKGNNSTTTVKEPDDKFEIKYQTNYYVKATRSFDGKDWWLGHLPQISMQTQQQQQQQQQEQQQLQLYLQQQQETTAWLLPHEYHHQHHHHLADYRLLFYNAEHQTHFYLHTLTNQNDFKATATATATTPTTLASFEAHETAHKIYQELDYNHSYFNKENANNDNNNHHQEQDKNVAAVVAAGAGAGSTMTNLTNAKHLNFITDTIGAAFGLNSRPAVAAIQGIKIEEIELYNGLSLRQSRFNPFNPCRILIHGWLGGFNSGMYNTLVPEYFKLQQGVFNIFTIDWGQGAFADYITASYRVKSVGITVAKFIDFLHQESGIDFENIHVIGFSMGAHIAGIAGKYVQTGRLPVIYGLDPALPLFRYENVNERLDIKDANYVEVLHTSVGSYGYDRPLGHVDFYINFGYNQPGCFFNECSHLKAFQIYSQNLYNERLQGFECLKELWWHVIKYKKCQQHKGKSLLMGVEGLTSSERQLRRGVFYVMT